MTNKRLFIIQEHNAEKAGLHWDIRFEDWRDNKRFLRSFVIPKHKLPEPGEKLLCISVNDHAYSYATFEGEISFGYGKGTVKQIYNDYVRIHIYNDKQIQFTTNDDTYRIYKASWMKDENNYLIKKL
jgi:hypothetical protein